MVYNQPVIEFLPVSCMEILIHDVMPYLENNTRDRLDPLEMAPE